MKTTLDINEPLFKRASALARKKGITLKELFHLALSQFLDSSKVQEGNFKLKDGSVGGGWLSKGMDNLSWNEIRALSERN